MPFCPNCETEYKGHVSVCPECGEHLLETSIDELEEVAVEAEEEQLLLYRSTSRDTSDTLSEALRDAAVPFTFKPGGRYFGGQALHGEFYVPEEDFDIAKEIVESTFGEVEEELE